MPTLLQWSRRSLMGFLVVLSCLSGVLGEGVHLLAEAHRWCVVHAAMEHADGVDARGIAIAHADEASPEDGGNSIKLEAGHGDTEEEHDLCLLFVATRGEDALLLAERRGDDRVSPQDCVMTPLRRAGVRPIALLRLAPKQSPPVV